MEKQFLLYLPYIAGDYAQREQLIMIESDSEKKCSTSSYVNLSPSFQNICTTNSRFCHKKCDDLWQK